MLQLFQTEAQLGGEGNEGAFVAVIKVDNIKTYGRSLKDANHLDT